MPLPVHPVGLSDGVPLTPSAFEENPEQAQRRLKAAYIAEEHALCLCRGGGNDLKLSIRKLEHGGTERYVLARYPNTGPAHDATCTYYEGDDGWGIEARTSGMVEWGPESARVRLRFGASRRDPTPPNPEAPGADGDASPGKKTRSKSPLTALGLLHLLWELAGMTRHEPDGKSWSWPRVAWRIGRAAEELFWGRSTVLADQLVFVTGGTDENRHATISTNDQILQAAVSGRRRVLVLGELFDLPSRSGGVAQIRLRQGRASYGIDLLGPGALAQGLAASYPTALAQVGSDAARCIALLLCDAAEGRDPPRRRWSLSVVDVGLMAVTGRDFLPFDSAYEREMLDRLVAEGRIFMKPLRYRGEDMLPDGILLDTAAPVPLEVWGRADEDYIARRAEKEALYLERYGATGWWGWNAAAGEPMPPLPPCAHAASSSTHRGSSSHVPA